MCIFCEIAKGNIPSYKLYEDDTCIAILDISQATIGHTLIIPKNHFDSIFDLDEEVAKHLFNVARLISIKMKNVVGVEGVNIVNNSGEIAGQSVKHFHIHVIPRRINDGFEINNISNKLSEDELKKLSNDLHL